MTVRDYDNWLVSLEADNFSSFIKVWFAYLATVHELVLNSVSAEEKEVLLKTMRGDGDFLKNYKSNHFHKISINESTKSSILECYKMSKNRIKTLYPEYYFVTYYKKIDDNVLYNNEKSTIAKDSFTYNVKVKSNNLYISVLFDKDAPINNFVKERFIDVKIQIVPGVDYLHILEDEDKFYRYILDSSNPIYNYIGCDEDSENYKRTRTSLSHIFQYILNTSRNELNLHGYIYKEKFRDSPTENDIKEWFYEFSYSLRNVLFHRVVDPFDKQWTNIVKYASQALHDIVESNIAQLKATVQP